jgi:hypothetical protein
MGAGPGYHQSPNYYRSQSVNMVCTACAPSWRPIGWCARSGLILDCPSPSLIAFTQLTSPDCPAFLPMAGGGWGVSLPTKADRVYPGLKSEFSLIGQHLLDELLYTANELCLSRVIWFWGPRGSTFAPTLLVNLVERPPPHRVIGQHRLWVCDQSFPSK